MDFSVNEMIERIKTKVPLKNIESLGFSQSTIATWKSRNTFPKADDLYKIADYLNVSMEWLLTGEIKDRFNPNPDLPPNEQELLNSYRLLDDATKAIINIQINALATSK